MSSDQDIAVNSRTRHREGGVHFLQKNADVSFYMRIKVLRQAQMYSVFGFRPSAFSNCPPALLGSA
jgi:hypothetical protein